jgi:hypothetical protein
MFMVLAKSVESDMVVRLTTASAAAVVALAVALPAAAGELKPEEARHFVAGKLFSYTCFDGTTGMGRISADGSVIGTMRASSSAPSRYVMLPSGTIKVKADSICASVRGMPFEPCFNIYQIDHARFRGSISGLSFASCTFTRVTPRLQVARSAGRSVPVQSAVATSAGE